MCPCFLRGTIICKELETTSFKTKALRKEDVKREWVVIDADSMIVGRLATEIARILRGKHKTNYTPHVDCGDNVIVINAEKVKFSGSKMENKTYLSHTGYPGGQRKTTPAELLQKAPERIVEKAVRGMLPKNRLGSRLFTHLHVYTGSEHPHAGQNPKEFKINN